MRFAFSLIFRFFFILMSNLNEFSWLGITWLFYAKINESSVVCCKLSFSLLCALAVREDLGPGAQAFSRKHPLACWLSTMLMIFSGGMVANGLLGEPILAPLKNSPQLYVATIVWYIVFYTPFDIGYKVTLYIGSLVHSTIYKTMLIVIILIALGWQIFTHQSRS